MKNKHFFTSKHSFLFFCLIIVLIQFFQIIFFEKAFFLERYDVNYWKDRFEHSQWEMPLSSRIIGDDGVYNYAGYRLMQGASIESTNANKPPVGLYLIGLSIVLFGSSAYFALFTGIGTLILFYLLAKRILNKNTAAFATSVLFLDPLFFTQLWNAYLDLIQFFFMLFNIVLFFVFLNAKKYKLVLSIGIGLTLGLFAETKPPVLLPIFFILQTFYFVKSKEFKNYFVYIFSIIFAALISYFRYLQLHPSIISLLKFHKYMSTIYTSSQNTVHHLAIWKVLFIGIFPDISSGLPTKVEEWWIIWPIVTFISLAYVSYLFYKKRMSSEILFLSIILLGSLFIFTIIPSFTRYLILVIPFLYLFSCLFYEKYFPKRLQKIGFIIVLTYAIFHAYLFLIPTSKAVLSDFYYNLQHEYFQDIYTEDLSSNKFIQEDKFLLLTHGTLQTAEILSIDVKQESVNENLFLGTGVVHAGFTYQTRDLGTFSEDKKIYLRLVNNQWKIVWNWNIVADGFMPGDKITLNRTVGKRGSIFDSNGNVLAKDSQSYLISVNPEKINTAKEQEMLTEIASMSGQEAVRLQDVYLENPLPNTYMPIATNFIQMERMDIDLLNSFSGVRLTPYPTRIYQGLMSKTLANTAYMDCCSRIYSSYSYHGISGIEKKYDTKLWGYDGGEIDLVKNNGTILKILLKKAQKNGENITI